MFAVLFCLALVKYQVELYHLSAVRKTKTKNTLYKEVVANALRLAEMIKIRQESKLNERYGYPRMQIALVQKGIKVGLKRVWRIMKEQGWTHKKRRCRCLTKTDPKAQIEENLLKQNFEADTPLTKLLTDITQIQCKEKE